MKIYTVLAENRGLFDQDVEVCATLELALKRAKDLLECNWGYEPLPYCGVLSSFAYETGNGIRITEHVLYNDMHSGGGVFVAVYEQDEIVVPLTSQNENHYDAPAKHLAASMCEEEDERILAKLDELASVPTLMEVDDYKHWSLPAGWDKNHKPIFMQAVYDDPSCVLPIDELTENEKFALTIARISQRPNYSFTFGSTTWNQKSALEELKREWRTWSSYDIVENEMEHLNALYNQKPNDC
jgi:hypothetical protein